MTTNNLFLITGLPRSRTAWMAAFMTNGDTICLHEPVMPVGHVYGTQGKKFVGISDSGLGFSLAALIERHAPKILIIERPIEEVETSLENMNTGLPKTNFCQLLKKELDAIKHPLIMRVPFHVLNDLRIMQKCFWHLTPGEPFDEGRFDQMKKINIQVSEIANRFIPSYRAKYDTPFDKLEVLR